VEEDEGGAGFEGRGFEGMGFEEGLDFHLLLRKLE
jgi:hypothetical protein